MERSSGSFGSEREYEPQYNKCWIWKTRANIAPSNAVSLAKLLLAYTLQCIRRHKILRMRYCFALIELDCDCNRPSRTVAGCVAFTLRRFSCTGCQLVRAEALMVILGAGVQVTTRIAPLGTSLIGHLIMCGACSIQTPTWNVTITKVSREEE